jgi:RNA polymerase sigma-70 factor (ECF subfamily)
LIEDQLARTQWQHRKRAKVQVAIRALPERQRKAVELRVWNGMAYEQIASTLGCTQMSVKALLFRAHTNLREKLAGAVA